MSSETRGKGFVHFNTPASIAFTQGQRVTRTDLNRKRSRVECVVLPHSQAAWRTAVKRYTKLEGYQAFAGDMEEEREGGGPLLPPLAPPSVAAAAQSSPSFFVAGRRSAADAASAGFLSSSSTLPTGVDTGATPGGITIVTHHKVSGESTFVYPDYDGVLTGGVVPEVVVTAEEQAEEASLRPFYISPLCMLPEESDAFEELQALWKSRASSHSVAGAQHRAVAGGVTPGEDEEVDAHLGHHKKRSGTISSQVAPQSSYQDAAEEELGDISGGGDQALAEALRLADELLNFV